MRSSPKADNSGFCYSRLTEPERWQWHAGVYAFRHVVLGASIEERVSPCDPEGKWYDDKLVGAAILRLQAKQKEERERYRRATGKSYRELQYRIADEWRSSPAGRDILAGRASSQ